MATRTKSITSAKTAGRVTHTQIKQVIGLIESGESERKACRIVGVSRATFRTTALRHESGDQYARALAALAHDQAEKLELAIDDMRKGKIDSQMARVEIDARKWFASKFLPRRYGDKIDVTSGGERVGTGVSPEQAEQLVRARANRSDS